MTNTLTFACSICGEPSTAICAYCTKDSCGNHLCERCGRCSDCCECEVRLEEPVEAASNGAYPILADQVDLGGDEPLNDDVEPTAENALAEELQVETPGPQEAVDAIAVENPEQEPPTVTSADTAAEEAPPEAPSADRHHE